MKVIKLILVLFNYQNEGSSDYQEYDVPLCGVTFIGHKYGNESGCDEKHQTSEIYSNKSNQ